MKGVFDTRPVTEYDDDISRRYQFPNRYLAEAKHTENDWIIYREPRRGGGRQAYVAVARVVSIEPDPSDPDSSYAYLSDYIEFDQVVPLRDGIRYYEARLNSVISPSHIGVALQGKSVRTVSEEEFGAIVLAGFAETLHEDNPHRLDYGNSEADRVFQAFVTATPEEQKRRIAQILANRPLRDWAFRRSVVTAYRETCAVTGLRMVNGGGKAEVQAAHIRAVASGGPDIVRNGIALSATCHWLFDRHLISLRNDYSLLVAHNRVPNEFQDLFSRQLKCIHLPDNEQLWPQTAYVEWHRERFLGG
ncbi:MAG: HNH endonuclease [Rhodobacteraceae bacterium]|nr:HNH endonuclease [Paracoccaceae bacterium]